MKRLTEWLRASPIVRGVLSGIAIAVVALFAMWVYVWLIHWLPWPPRG